MKVPDNLPNERGSITSPDGTRLGYICIGTGGPLVVCHGSFSSAEDWLPFAIEMASTHSVYLYDRRGRGSSPYIAADFAIDAEVEDLSAMVDLAGSEAAVLGHSFGGGCALSFAARNRFSGPLVLYEPRHSAIAPMSRGQRDELERLVATGDRETALRFALSHIVGAPADAIAGFHQSPLWEPMCETVHAFAKELRLLDTLNWQSGDLDAIAGPVTLLVGEHSPVLPEETSPDIALQKLLPGMRTASIPGQGHFAFVADPALMAKMVRLCLSEPRG
tara:strand:- start:4325 stop:5152 length:828 start_codon:yes stop_codon:yes gene_type:complete